MPYDPDDLRQLQAFRAVIDPIPLHPQGQHVTSRGAAGALDPQEVVSARLDQVATQDEPAPIEQAPWPEAMLCVWSTFNDARFATSPQWVGVVKATFREYLSSRGLDPYEMVPTHFFEGALLPSGLDPDAPTPSDATVHDLRDADEMQWMGITETHREEAEAFRRRIKHARDRVFLEEVYDELQAVPEYDLDVPKIVWKDAALDVGADADAASTGTKDEQAAQTGLDMF